MRHHIGRHGRQILPIAALELEPLSERRVPEDLVNLGHDAAHDVDAAARAEGQGHIASESAEHGAEYCNGFAALWIAAGIEIGDVFGRRRGSGLARKLAQRIVKIDEAWS